MANVSGKLPKLYTGPLQPTTQLGTLTDPTTTDPSSERHQRVIRVQRKTDIKFLLDLVNMTQTKSLNIYHFIFLKSWTYQLNIPQSYWYARLEKDQYFPQAKL